MSAADAGAVTWSLPLLEARLAPPLVREGTIRRQAVLDRLRANRRRRVAIIEAPAGYGKTTVAATWAREDGRRVAWYSLCERDDNPRVLLGHLSAALTRAGVDVGLLLEPAGSARTRPARMTAALASAFRCAPEPVLLVLDDVHLLERRVCRAVVASVVENVAPGSQVLLTSRTALDLPCERLRAERQLLELGTTDLRMTDPDAAALLRAAGASSGETGAALLNARCEGWPTGLYLAAIALRSGDARSDSFNGADRIVSDYFSLEVLDGLEAHERDLVVRASALDRVCGSLADEVLDCKRSAEVLAALADSNRFVTRLDDDREWFRFHPLFRETLRARLDRLSPGFAARVLERAADWYTERGEHDAALQCAVEADDRGRVAELVPVAVLPALAGGRRLGAERWLPLMDDARELEDRPAIGVIGAWHCALTGQGEGARHWARAAFSSRDRRSMPDGSKLETWRAGLRALLCADGVGVMAQDAQLAVDGLPADSPFVPYALQLLAFAHLLEGDSERADRELSAALEAAALCGASMVVSTTLAMQALLTAARGRTRAAVELAQAARDVIREANLDDQPASVFAYVASARGAIESGARAVAREESERAEQLLRRLAAIPWAAALMSLELAQVQLMLDSTARARRLVDRIDEIALDVPDLGVIRERAASLKHDIERGRSADDRWQSILTPAELRLLPVLATHLTFREIAEHLGLSRNTVKTQAIALYRKLDVSSRSNAIRRATELGFL
jgi:LuxR family transcriptional regulator, maltose regulon positive regulatory protein